MAAERGGLNMEKRADFAADTDNYSGNISNTIHRNG